MKCLAINNLVTTLFLAFFFLLLSNTTQGKGGKQIVNYTASTKKNLLEAKGGPRNVIQERTSIIVVQPTNSYLEIIIVNQNGKQLYEGSTTTCKTIISTETMAKGECAVITTDIYGDQQIFYINIE